MKNLEEITYEELKAEIIKLAKENPDFVYPREGDPIGESTSCFYTANNPENKPACLFGQALLNLGVSEKHNEMMSGGTINYFDIDWGNGEYEVEERKLEFCAVQKAQDVGYSWGTAVKKLN